MYFSPKPTVISAPTDMRPLGGGVHHTTNRSTWPTNGGALSLIPGHAWALTAVNIALGNNVTEEGVYSNPFTHVMVPFFNQTGGNETFCIPKLKIPPSIAPDVSAGVNATIQVIQLTPTGAALYNCLDITFSDDEANRFGDPKVWDEYCYNGTGISALRLGEKGPPPNGTLTSAASGRALPMHTAWTALATAAVVALVMGGAVGWG
ncbi:hypothetical protein EDC01DRAFT_642729 [Geopyxis carbonaria]|nr:hypothetical protein EDC01DRAFT_642729 [Geopyxis carbonaria]